MFVEVLNSIDEVDGGELDSLADSPLYTWGWLKTMEGSSVLDMEPRHIVVRDGEGLLAFVPCYLRRRVIFDDLRYEILHKRHARVLDFIGGFGLGYMQFMPSLTCGPPEGFSSRVLIAPRGVGHRNQIIHAVLDVLEDQAGEDGVGFYGMIGVSKSDHVLSRVLLDRGYTPCLRNAEAVLDVKWENQKEYLAHLTRNQRKSFKAESKKFSKENFVLKRYHSYSPITERLSKLASNVYSRYNLPLNPFDARFFWGLEEFMGREAEVFAAEREGVIEAYNLTLYHEAIVKAFFWGSNYSSTSRSGQAYYTVCYHGPIIEAIERGASRVEFGPSAWREKAKYGCRFEPMMIYLRANSRVDSFILPLFLKRVNHEKKRWLEDRIPSIDLS